MKCSENNFKHFREISIRLLIILKSGLDEIQTHPDKFWYKLYLFRFLHLMITGVKSGRKVVSSTMPDKIIIRPIYFATLLCTIVSTSNARAVTSVRLKLQHRNSKARSRIRRLRQDETRPQHISRGDLPACNAYIECARWQHNAIETSEQSARSNKRSCHCRKLLTWLLTVADHKPTTVVVNWEQAPLVSALIWRRCNG